MKTQLMEVMTELKVEVAKLETALTSEIATHYRLQEESGQAKERLAELINRLEQSEQEMLGNDDEVISLETQIEQQKESRESIVEKFKNNV